MTVYVAVSAGYARNVACNIWTTGATAGEAIDQAVNDAGINHVGSDGCVAYPTTRELQAAVEAGDIGTWQIINGVAHYHADEET